MSSLPDAPRDTARRHRPAPHVPASPDAARRAAGARYARQATQAEPRSAAPSATAITPMLCVADVAAALDVYRRMGLEAVQEFPDDEGRPQRAILRHGDTLLHIVPARALPEEGEHGRRIEAGPRGLGVILYLRVEDADAAHGRALAAGARSAQDPRDEPWGDRVGRCIDPFGFDWCFAAPVGAQRGWAHVG